MGKIRKFNGKVITAYITQTGVRIAEGENKNGSPYVYKFFTVYDVSDCFSEIATDPGTYEIINMSRLVETIVTELQNHNITTKKIMVCSNCLGIDTTINSDTGGSSIREMLTGDLLSFKRNKESSKSNNVSPDKIISRVTWGSLVEDGVSVKKTTESIGDKFTLKSLVQEFYNRDYDVINISDNISCLFNLRHTEEATFDSQGKLLYDFEESINKISFFKDIPVKIDKFSPMTEQDIIERIVNMVESDLENVGRNPIIYLTGAMFKNTFIYNEIIDRLETAGFIVYDMFNRPLVDPETGLNPETGVPVMTPDYYCNIAMLISTFSSNAVSIVPKLDFADVFRKNSKALSTLILGASLLSLVISGGFAGYRLYTMNYISLHPPRATSMESQIQSLEGVQQSLESTVNTLTQADVTVLDLMNFINTHENEFVTIITVDTMDMLPLSMEVDGGDSDTSEDSFEPHVIGAREPIIIRGYSRTGPAAVSYYNSLFNSGLPVDPVLNGIEKYALPDGDEVFVFEIQVGGVE